MHSEPTVYPNQIKRYRRNARKGQVWSGGCVVSFLWFEVREMLWAGVWRLGPVQVLLLSVVSRLRPSDLEPTTTNQTTLSQRIVQNKH